jgi:hypothetical protein
MKWIWQIVFLLVVVCGIAGVAVAQEYFGGAQTPDRWPDSVTPSGLRFSGDVGGGGVSVRTGDYGGYGGGGGGGYGYGYGGYGGNCPCGGGGAGICLHWTLLPWYAPWPTAHDLYKQQKRACCVNPMY